MLEFFLWAFAYLFVGVLILVVGLTINGETIDPKDDDNYGPVLAMIVFWPLVLVFGGGYLLCTKGTPMLIHGLNLASDWLRNALK